MKRPGVFWRVLNLPCREACRLASEALDRDLGWADRLALRGHLLGCAACRRYRRQIGRLRDALRHLARAEPETGPEAALPGPGLPEDVRRRISRALKEG